MKERLATSVIIPAYNCASFIGTAIESVYRQSLNQPIEIVVVDDGSADNLLEVIQGYQAKGLVYLQQTNQGPAAARNRGLFAASGEFVAFLDADDEWLPDHLEKALDFLERGKFDWVATGFYKRWPDGRSEYKTFPRDSYMFDRPSGRVTLLQNGLFHFSSVPIWTGTVLFRRKCLLQLKGFDRSFRIGEDSDLYLRAEEAGLNCGFLDEPTAVYNHIPTSITKSGRIDGLKEHLRLAEKHARLLGMKVPLIRKSYSDFIWKSASIYAEQGNYPKCFSCCVRSFMVYPELEKVRRLLRQVWK